MEGDFTSLNEQLGLAGLRLDRTWADGRKDTWRLAGGANPLLQLRFNSLATPAGRLLGALDPGLLPDAVAQEADPRQKWFLMAWTSSSPRADYGIEKYPDGSERVLFFGSLESPAAVSSALCLHLAAQTTAVPTRLDSQLGAPRYAAVLRHWDKSAALLASDPQDLENGAKEAVSAVEALAQLVTGQPSATLGDSIKRLRAKGTVAAPLLKGLEELWGFTSNQPGVRHGSGSLSTLAAHEAQYVFEQSAAALRLLLSLDGTA